jgi:hypothetical protein
MTAGGMDVKKVFHMSWQDQSDLLDLWWERRRYKSRAQTGENCFASALTHSLPDLEKLRSKAPCQVMMWTGSMSHACMLGRRSSLLLGIIISESHRPGSMAQESCPPSYSWLCIVPGGSINQRYCRRNHSSVVHIYVSKQQHPQK